MLFKRLPYFIMHNIHGVTITIPEIKTVVKHFNNNGATCRLCSRQSQICNRSSTIITIVLQNISKFLGIQYLQILGNLLKSDYLKPTFCMKNMSSLTLGSLPSCARRCSLRTRYIAYAYGCWTRCILMALR